MTVTGKLPVWTTNAAAVRSRSLLTQQLRHRLHQQPHVHGQLGDLLALVFNRGDQPFNTLVHQNSSTSQPPPSRLRRTFTAMKRNG